MIREGSQIDHDDVLDVDVCIVGAGPAGLALASALDADGRRICLLESGGPTFDAQVQDLAAMEISPDDNCYEDPQGLRRFGVGGTASRWTIEIDGDHWFRAAKLPAFDFEARPWLPHSGWAISADDLGPWYDQALQLCHLDPTCLDADRWRDSAHEPLRSPDGHLDTSMFVFARSAVFTDELPSRLAASPRVTLVRRATCVELESRNGGAQVTRARVRTLEGRQFHVAARAMVLTQGGFEVPRLLLASRSEVRVGLGNQHDLVGRFFNDHQIVKAGRITSDRPDLASLLAFYDIHHGGDLAGAGTLTLDDQLRDREQLLASSLMIVPVEPHTARWRAGHLFGRETTAYSPSLAAARAFKQAVADRRFPSRPHRLIADLARDLDDLVYAVGRNHGLFHPPWTIDRGGWSEPAPDRDGTGVVRRRGGAVLAPPRPVAVAAGAQPLAFEAFQFCEQAPDPDNRITLSDDVDALGMPRARLRFRWNEWDRRSVVQSQQFYDRALAAAGAGGLDSGLRRGEPLVRQMSAHHPAGTTRMSDDPAAGVVDRNGRVHGTQNLFVASSSVFPTSGFTPPTLTIIALALRLADHVGRLLSQGSLPS